MWQKLVVKPDQLIKRRGKLGLVKVNVSLDEVRAWLGEKMGKELQVCVCAHARMCILGSGCVLVWVCGCG